jgi:hypothetical protein
MLASTTLIMNSRSIGLGTLSALIRIVLQFGKAIGKITLQQLKEAIGFGGSGDGRGRRCKKGNVQHHPGRAERDPFILTRG